MELLNLGGPIRRMRRHRSLQSVRPPTCREHSDSRRTRPPCRRPPLREQFRVDERIGDSVGRKRILEVTGIAHECPAGSERLSKESYLSRKPAVFQPFPTVPQPPPGRTSIPSILVGIQRPCRVSSSRGTASVEPRQICTSARHWSESRRRSHQGCSTSGSRRTPGLTSS